MIAPLTPTDCNCQGLSFMPLEVSRLVDSDLVALSTGDEFKAAFILWAKAWTQVPAASVPDDDRILARWVGCSLNEWLGLREMALRGWVKCSDGRLYHPLIADLAVKANEKRRGQSDRANSRWAKARAAKAAEKMPRHEETDAAVSSEDAGLMQGRGTVEGIDPPTVPPGDGNGRDPETPNSADQVQQAFDAWNVVAERCDLPIAKDLTPARRKRIGARVKAKGLEGWDDALRAVELSALCRGQRPPRPGQLSAWRADLDFVCQAKSFQRLREGFYGTDAKPVRIKDRVESITPDQHAEHLRHFQDTGEWRDAWGPRPLPEVGPAVVPFLDRRTA